MMQTDDNASTSSSYTPVACALQDATSSDCSAGPWHQRRAAESQQRRRRQYDFIASYQLSLFVVFAGILYVSGFSGLHSPSTKVSIPSSAVGESGMAPRCYLGSSSNRSSLVPRERRKGREGPGLNKWLYGSIAASGLSPLLYRNLGTDETTTTNTPPKRWNSEEFWERLFGAEKKYFIFDDDDDDDDDEEEMDGKMKVKLDRREEREDLRRRRKIVREWRKEKKRRRKTERKRERAQRREEPGRRMTQEEFEEQRARLEYAMRYTDVSTLRSVFGVNRNPWGDLDVERSRKLYRILLPRLLLALYELGYYDPNILAPLAYHTRKAAKQYARERCSVPGRILAMAYDGFRSWRDYGTFSVEGLTWEQLWAKYERQVREEHIETTNNEEDEAVVDDDLKMRIYRRILQRSCVTNEEIDAIIFGKEFLEDKKKDPSNMSKRKYEVQGVAQRLEREVRRVILKDDDDDDEGEQSHDGTPSSKLGLLIPHVVTTVINSARRRVVMSFKEAFDDPRALSPLVFFQPPPSRPLLPIEIAALKMMDSSQRRWGIQH